MSNTNQIDAQAVPEHIEKSAEKTDRLDLNDVIMHSSIAALTMAACLYLYHSDWQVKVMIASIALATTLLFYT